MSGTANGILSADSREGNQGATESTDSEEGTNRTPSMSGDVGQAEELRLLKEPESTATDAECCIRVGPSPFSKRRQ